MKNTYSNIGLVLSTIAISVIVGCTVLAWIEPGANPPDDNVDAPITTSLTTQTKSGGLNLASTSGNVGIGTIAPTKKLDVAGQVQGQELCINGSCCNSWSSCLLLACTPNCSGKACGDNGCGGSCGTCSGSMICNTSTGQCVSSCTPNCSGKTCGSNGCGGSCGTCATGYTCSGSTCVFNPSTYPCSGGALPASGAIKNKRMFVTSDIYDATTFVTTWYNTSKLTGTISDETIADEKCQNLAGTAGFTGGTFKAMVYMGKRDISTIVPSGSVFWSCSSTSGWKQIATGFSDFFSADGSGNYLNSQIYNEFGNSSGVTVWTGFEPNGGGGYTLLSATNSGLCTTKWTGWWGSCINGTSNWTGCAGYTCSTSAVAWYGAANSTSGRWAHAGDFKECQSKSYGYYSTLPWENCAAVTRALYCIEQ